MLLWQIAFATRGPSDTDHTDPVAVDDVQFFAGGTQIDALPGSNQTAWQAARDAVGQ